mmetsp:Transcript_14492/g.43811  ORF Transcript_14492/g.43811 Transcript_14492/m.43811 type:complete len:211 (+) Transcript_14492:1754-2386(+)
MTTRKRPPFRREVAAGLLHNTLLRQTHCCLTNTQETLQEIVLSDTRLTPTISRNSCCVTYTLWPTFTRTSMREYKWQGRSTSWVDGCVVSSLHRHRLSSTHGSCHLLLSSLGQLGEAHAHPGRMLHELLTAPRDALLLRALQVLAPERVDALPEASLYQAVVHLQAVPHLLLLNGILQSAPLRLRQRKISHACQRVGHPAVRCASRFGVI